MVSIGVVNKAALDCMLNSFTISQSQTELRSRFAGILSMVVSGEIFESQLDVRFSFGADQRISNKCSPTRKRLRSYQSLSKSKLTRALALHMHPFCIELFARV